MIKVDAMGDTCPIPVVKTKNAIKELKGSGEVQTLVDNEIAVQNLTKMANQKGYGVKSQKLGEGKYEVTMTISDGNADAITTTGDSAEEEQIVCYPDARKKNTVVVLASATMGAGDEELGEILMKGFIYALSQQEELPATILLYNGGVVIMSLFTSFAGCWTGVNFSISSPTGSTIMPPGCCPVRSTASYRDVQACGVQQDSIREALSYFL